MTCVRLLALLIALAGLAAAAEKGGRPHGDLRDRLIERFDTDKDGKLSESERQAARAAFQERLGKRFDRLDANHDGSISREEFLGRRHHGHRRDGGGTGGDKG